MENLYNLFLIGMSAAALIVFIALYFINAGYGMYYTKKWGISLPNRLGWIIMEAPVFVLMAVLWWNSDRQQDLITNVMFIIFELHYFQRSFIFPFLIKRSSQMPLSIISMGITFNSLNAIMQGGWLFYVSPLNYYPADWLSSWPFIVGTCLFFGGAFINIWSDKIIRSLRKDANDKKHYMPQKGMFKYITSANYFGEFVEWCGFALLTFSWAGVVFAWWTFANLAPRAASVHQKYKEMFPENFANRKIKRILPYIY